VVHKLAGLLFGSRESVIDALAAARKGGKVVVMGYVTLELGVPG